jgi:aryl-alcohol dehydrogenase-like predicted oxidoreductase
MLEAHGLGLIVFSPLAGGYLTGKYRDGATGGRRSTIPFPPVDEARGAHVLKAMDGIASRHDATHEAIALAWLRRRPSVTSIITGVKSAEQLAANIKAVEVTLSDEEMDALGDAAPLAIEYPGWMLAQGSAARASLLSTGAMPTGH